jgi:transcriptional regulator with XRE-family HTH domain
VALEDFFANILVAFGETLRELRLARGYSQEQLAQLIGVSTQAVRNWEAGRHQPTTHHLQRLAGNYGIALDELLRQLPRVAFPIEESSIPISITGYLMAGEDAHPPSVPLGAINIPETIRREHSRVFGLIVRGDSLLTDEIADGDVVLVDPDAEPVEGSIEVVLIGDSLFPRVVRSEPEANNHEEPLPGNAQRVGKVVWHLRRL